MNVKSPHVPLQIPEESTKTNNLLAGKIKSNRQVVVVAFLYAECDRNMNVRCICYVSMY